MEGETTCPECVAASLRTRALRETFEFVSESMSHHVIILVMIYIRIVRILVKTENVDEELWENLIEEYLPFHGVQLYR